MSLFNTFLFWLQIIFAVVFGVFQTNHMLMVSTSGLSVSVFLCTEIFFAINIYLSFSAYKQHREKELFRTLLVYIAYFLMYGTFLVVLEVLTKGSWDSVDTQTMLFMVLFVSGALVYARIQKLPFLDPVVKGLYSLGFKTIPQLMMAWKIVAVGGSGIGIVMLVIVHILTSIRLGQIWFHAITMKRWDRNLIGLMLAEIGNEASWILVTIAWMMY